MKVLDLQCRQGHRFEGWFASQEDYESQRARALLSCPVCNDADIARLPSAPRLNLGSVTPAASTDSAPVSVGSAPEATASTLPVSLQAAVLQMVRHVMAHTEDVGPRFAEEARRIHYGEIAQRNIRGQASHEETQALLDEGIDVLPLPILPGLKEPLQ